MLQLLEMLKGQFDSLDQTVADAAGAYAEARLRQQLARHLEQSPEQHGLPCAVWDGPTLVVHLQRRFGVELTVRQAQKWLHRPGYRLKRGSYVFLQARAQDAARLRRRWQGEVVHLFVDRARWHRGPRVQKYLAVHPPIQMEYFPP